MWQSVKYFSLYYSNKVLVPNNHKFIKSRPKYTKVQPDGDILQIITQLEVLLYCKSLYFLYHIFHLKPDFFSDVCAFIMGLSSCWISSMICYTLLYLFRSWSANCDHKVLTSADAQNRNVCARLVSISKNSNEFFTKCNIVSKCEKNSIKSAKWIIYKWYKMSTKNTVIINCL